MSERSKFFFPVFQNFKIIFWKMASMGHGKCWEKQTHKIWVHFKHPPRNHERSSTRGGSVNPLPCRIGLNCWGNKIYLWFVKPWIPLTIGKPISKLFPPSWNVQSPPLTNDRLDDQNISLKKKFWQKDFRKITFLERGGGTSNTTFVGLRSIPIPCQFFLHVDHRK